MHLIWWQYIGTAHDLPVISAAYDLQEVGRRVRSGRGQPQRLEHISQDEHTQTVQIQKQQATSRQQVQASRAR